MNQTKSFFRFRFLFFLIFLSSSGLLAGSNVFSRFTKIAEVKNYSIDQTRDIYKTFDSEDQAEQGLPVDPFDLMNRLKRAGAMNNATTPSDALDEALHAFDESEYENVPIK